MIASYRYTYILQIDGVCPYGTTASFDGDGALTLSDDDPVTLSTRPTGEPANYPVLLSVPTITAGKLRPFRPIQSDTSISVDINATPAMRAMLCGRRTVAPDAQTPTPAAMILRRPVISTDTVIYTALNGDREQVVFAGREVMRISAVSGAPVGGLFPHTIVDRGLLGTRAQDIGVGPTGLTLLSNGPARTIGARVQLFIRDLDTGVDTRVFQGVVDSIEDAGEAIRLEALSSIKAYNSLSWNPAPVNPGWVKRRDLRVDFGGPISHDPAQPELGAGVAIGGPYVSYPRGERDPDVMGYSPGILNHLFSVGLWEDSFFPGWADAEGEQFGATLPTQADTPPIFLPKLTHAATGASWPILVMTTPSEEWVDNNIDSDGLRPFHIWRTTVFNPLDIDGVATTDGASDVVTPRSPLTLSSGNMTSSYEIVTGVGAWNNDPAIAGGSAVWRAEISRAGTWEATVPVADATPFAVNYPRTCEAAWSTARDASIYAANPVLAVSDVMRGEFAGVRIGSLVPDDVDRLRFSFLGFVGVIFNATPDWTMRANADATAPLADIQRAVLVPQLLSGDKPIFELLQKTMEFVGLSIAVDMGGKVTAVSWDPADMELATGITDITGSDLVRGGFGKIEHNQVSLRRVTFRKIPRDVDGERQLVELTVVSDDLMNGSNDAEELKFDYIFSSQDLDLEDLRERWTRIIAAWQDVPTVVVSIRRNAGNLISAGDIVRFDQTVLRPQRVGGGWGDDGDLLGMVLEAGLDLETMTQELKVALYDWQN